VPWASFLVPGFDELGEQRFEYCATRKKLLRRDLPSIPELNVKD
jgi:hypothetical protein